MRNHHSQTMYHLTIQHTLGYESLHKEIKNQRCPIVGESAIIGHTLDSHGRGEVP